MDINSILLIISIVLTAAAGYIAFVAIPNKK